MIFFFAQPAVPVVFPNARFPKDKTKWTFLLLGSGIDEDSKLTLREKDNTSGVYIDQPNLLVVVKDWGQVIHEAHARYKYLENQLSMAASNSEGIKYLQDKYSEILPNVMTEVACTNDC